MTTKSALSRRYLLAAGASLAIACGGTAPPAPSSGTAPAGSHAEKLIRSWYAAWLNKDWASVDALSADDFTFSSGAGDDHISKATYKTQCWDTQSGLIDHFQIESLLDNGGEAFVKYVCWTKNGKSFRNVEHFTFRGDKIAALECYFGGAGYPSAANKS